MLGSATVVSKVLTAFFLLVLFRCNSAPAASDLVPPETMRTAEPRVEMAAVGVSEDVNQAGAVSEGDEHKTASLGRDAPATAAKSSDSKPQSQASVDTTVQLSELEPEASVTGILAGGGAGSVSKPKADSVGGTFAKLDAGSVGVGQVDAGPGTLDGSIGAADFSGLVDGAAATSPADAARAVCDARFSTCQAEATERYDGCQTPLDAECDACQTRCRELVDEVNRRQCEDGCLGSECNLTCCQCADGLYYDLENCEVDQEECYVAAGIVGGVDD